jgi:hypothetical protein
MEVSYPFSLTLHVGEIGPNAWLPYAKLGNFGGKSSIQPYGPVALYTHEDCPELQFSIFLACNFLALRVLYGPKTFGHVLIYTCTDTHTHNTSVPISP